MNYFLFILPFVLAIPELIKAFQHPNPWVFRFTLAGLGFAITSLVLLGMEVEWALLMLLPAILCLLGYYSAKYGKK